MFLSIFHMHHIITESNVYINSYVTIHVSVSSHINAYVQFNARTYSHQTFNVEADQLHVHVCRHD